MLKCKPCRLQTVQTEYFFFYLYLIFLLNIYYSKYFHLFPASLHHVHRSATGNDE